METERLNVKVCVQDLLDYLNDLGQERVNKLISKDNQQKIKEFLVYMGISDKENIRVHGAS